MSDANTRERNLELIALAQKGDSNAEEKLLKENSGLVRSIVRRFLGRGTDEEDLLQIGTIGMLKAVRSFSLESGNAFSTYAVPLVLGELKRHFRDNGPVKVSRICKQKSLALLRERAKFESENGREPTLFELAGRCSMEPEEAAMALQSTAPVASFFDPVADEDGLTYGDILADEDSQKEFESLRDSLSIAQSMKKLPELWKKILLLRYFRNLTQQKTALLLGLTQVKVSREEKKILDFLRKELA
ncbi:MAG: sigma-70 family RNA polymerase sigma factor [Clostridia bacterium]|nr:sigma-70 family RNA polymerase sigma factor [Clostridia bacterium]